MNLKLVETVIQQSSQKLGDSVNEIFSHWQGIFKKPRARLDENRIKIIQRRMADGYTVKDLQDAISGCYLSEFHQGDNDHHKKYNDIGLILRDAAHVDQFIELYEQGQEALKRNAEIAVLPTAAEVSTAEHAIEQLNKMKKMLGRR